MTTDRHTNPTNQPTDHTAPQADDEVTRTRISKSLSLSEFGTSEKQVLEKRKGRKYDKVRLQISRL